MTKETKAAIITGVTGQDGSYLCEFLLKKGYEVVGIKRRSSTDNNNRIKHLLEHHKFSVVEGDITDSSNVNSWFMEFKPYEFYNLAAQSHVGTSFKQPKLTWRVNSESVINILEAIKTYSPKTRFYQASTSEMFGKNFTTYGSVKFQNEDTPFNPQSPYGVAKLAAHQAVGMYREAYSLHASAGILFNHESERRGEQFVTRKITKWIGEFKRWAMQVGFMENSVQGLETSSYIYGPDQSRYPKLRLGNLDAYRDWGHAEDYVKAMWLMLQQDKPDDYVICTGKTYTVEHFLINAFKCVNIENYKDFIVQDERFMRPAEVDYLCGDNYKALHILEWRPKVDFNELVKRMVEHDIKEIK